MTRQQNSVIIHDIFVATNAQAARPSMKTDLLDRIKSSFKKTTANPKKRGLSAKAARARDNELSELFARFKVRY